MKELSGLGLSPGRSQAPAHWLLYSLSLEDSATQYLSWEDARQIVVEKLQQSEEEAESEVLKELLVAQQMIADDPELANRVQAHVQSGEQLADAIENATAEIAAEFERMDDPYWQARADDVRDVGRQLLAAVQGRGSGRTSLIPGQPVIVMAEKLFPSDTVNLSHQDVRGFLLREGSPTSHVAILARSWGIPAVVLGPGLNEIGEGDVVFLDGEKGIVVIDPDPSLSPASDHETIKWPILSDHVFTLDGISIHIEANIGSVDDARRARNNGADGVGLLRTEFLFNRDQVPDEDEQFELLMQMARIMDGKPMVVRLADIGGDKPVPFLDLPAESNPFLGVRAIRLLPRYPHLYDAQIRAVLRVGQQYPVQLLFPMVATIEDWSLCRSLVEQIRSDTQLNPILVGCMIEVPSAVWLADVLAQTADFFSIGTNDLIQYLFAADRTAPSLINYYQPLNPAVLRAIKHVIAVGEHHHIPVSVCGEMAGDPVNLEILLGLGLNRLSVDPYRIPEVKNRVRTLDIRSCKQAARRFLTQK